VKLRCERDTLVEALQTAGRAVSGRGGQLPVLSGLHLVLSGDQLVVTGSDLELTIARTLEVNGETDGSAVIPAKLLIDVVRSLEPGAIELDLSELNLTIRGGRSEFSIRTIPTDEFPQLATAEGPAVTIEAASFVAALKQVVPAASSDDSRPILTGVLLTPVEAGLRLVATDSYRLAVSDIPGASVLEGEQSVLVPSRALAEVRRVVGDAPELTLRLGESDAAFVVDGLVVTTRLIDGDFPKYEGLIPTGDSNALKVSRETMLDAVRRVRLLAQESTPLRLVMNSDGLEIVAITQDVGEGHESVDASYDGEELTVAFNPAFLVDGLDVAPGEEVELHTIDSLKPAVLRTPGNEHFLYLLMPVRVP